MTGSRAKPFAPRGSAVLITGASSGLGKAAALHLERIGYTVYAGVRKAEDGQALVSESTQDRIRPVHMDLTDEDSVHRAATEVAEATAEDGLWGLVNNAGTCALGPLELLPPARLREALETNVIGHHILTAALLPSLRRTRGRIVNVGSGLGRVAAPYHGGYAVTQFGKEGFSDAQRRELRPFGIGVSVIEPGAIATPIFDKLTAEARRLLDNAAPEKAERYRERFLALVHHNQQGARQLATSPEQYARTVAHALGARRPRTRYAVGRDWQTMRAVYRALPDRLIDRAYDAVVRKAVDARVASAQDRGPCAENTVLRPLGTTECWYRLADHAAPFNVSARMRIDGKLDPESLRGALALMQRRHPLMRAAVRDIGGVQDPVFVSVPHPIPLRTATLHDTDEQWQRELNDFELAERIDVQSGPAVRAVLLSTPDGAMHDLLLVASHIIADANTLLSMIAECGQLAAAVQAGEQPDVVANPAPGAVDTLVPAGRRGHRPRELLRTAMSVAREEYATRRQRPVRITGQRDVPFTQRRSRMLHRTLPAERVAELSKWCREHGTTVHGALGAAMVIAAARCGEGFFGSTADDRRITLSSPIDIRDRLDPPVATDQIGAFVSMVPTHAHYRRDADFWHLAREITTDLDTRQQRGEHFSALNLNRMVVPREVERGQRALRAVEQRGPANFCLSNIGRFEVTDQAAGLRFSQAQMAAGLGAGCYLAVVVNTTHGQLSMNITHLREVISDEVAQRFGDECMAALNAAFP